MPTAKWYDIKAQSGTRAEIYIFGVVVDYKWYDDDDDVTAKEFIDAIKNLGDLDVHINSPGGSVPAGNAIYNALRRHKGDVAVYIDGMAASIASVIAMAGSRVIMPENALLMIHDPWSYAVGNAADMRKTADTLDKFKSGLVAAYRDKTGLDEDVIATMMSAEAWITAAEAVEMGFADELEQPIAVAARFDLSRYKNVPQALLQTPPARATGSTAKPTKEYKPMNLEELRQKHPDLVAQVEARAREGLIAATEAETARIQAVTAEGDRIFALVEHAVGAEAGGKIRAAAAKGLTAEDLQALGVSLAPPQAATGDDPGSRAAMLAAITNAAPQGVRTGTGQTGEQAEEAAVIENMLAGAAGRRR